MRHLEAPTSKISTILTDERQEFDTIARGDSESLDALVEGMRLHGIDIESRETAVLHPVSQIEGDQLIDNLRRSMAKLSEFEQARGLGFRADEVRTAWTNLRSPSSHAWGPDVDYHTMVDSWIEETWRVMGVARTIVNSCTIVSDKVREHWPNVHRRVRHPHARFFQREFLTAGS